MSEMTRYERLERWAVVVEAHQGMLRPLVEVEFMSGAARAPLRQRNSPLNVAY